MPTTPWAFWFLGKLPHSTERVSKQWRPQTHRHSDRHVGAALWTLQYKHCNGVHSRKKEKNKHLVHKHTGTTSQTLLLAWVFFHENFSVLTKCFSPSSYFEKLMPLRFFATEKNAADPEPHLYPSSPNPNMSLFFCFLISPSWASDGELREGGQNCARWRNKVQFYHLLLTSSLVWKKKMRLRHRVGVNWTIMGCICNGTITAIPQKSQSFFRKQSIFMWKF